MDRIEELIMDMRVDNARVEEKLINLEAYIVKDLKEMLESNSKRIEARFKWMVGLFITFIGVAIGVPLAI